MDVLTHCQWKSSKSPALAGISTQFSLSRVRPRVPVEQGLFIPPSDTYPVPGGGAEGHFLPIQSSRRGDGQRKRTFPLVTARGDARRAAPIPNWAWRVDCFFPGGVEQGLQKEGSGWVQQGGGHTA